MNCQNGVTEINKHCDKSKNILNNTRSINCNLNLNANIVDRQKISLTTTAYLPSINDTIERDYWSNSADCSTNPYCFDNINSINTIERGFDSSSNCNYDSQHSLATTLLSTHLLSSSSNSSTSSTNPTQSPPVRDLLMENLQQFMETQRQKKHSNVSDEDDFSQNQHNDEKFSAMPSTSTNTSIDAVVSHHNRINTNQFRQKSNIIIPFMLQSDSKFSSLKSTRILDQLISCFVVGGECRLCMPQLIGLVLLDIPLREIDEMLINLGITNMQANKEQIQILKMSGALPPTVSTCELITKSNAERLVAQFLTNGQTPMDQMIRERLYSIQIAHDCFGGCSGRLYPCLIPEACIECRDCNCLFRPEHFCTHSHATVGTFCQPTANNAVPLSVTEHKVHWGFDSSNWAYYLHIDDAFVRSMDETTNRKVEEEFVRFIYDYRNMRQRLTSLITITTTASPPSTSSATTSASLVRITPIVSSSAVSPSSEPLHASSAPTTVIL